MNRLIKLSNPLIFTILLAVLLITGGLSKISTSPASLLPDGEAKKTYELFNDFGQSKQILVAVKGFDQASREMCRNVAALLLKNPSIVEKKPPLLNEALQKYINKYRFYTTDIGENPAETFSLSKKLASLYLRIISDPFVTLIDPADPLNIFTQAMRSGSGMKIKNGYLALDDYGYMMVFNVKPGVTTLEGMTEVYESIHRNLERFENVTVFSPFFYYVENSAKIKNEVNFIILLSSCVLLLLYIIILKNFTLFAHTIMTIGTSIMVGIIALSLIWDEISIFVLVFGVAVSTIAIDYMFHHYLHHHYNSSKPFNRAVFYGFLTTVTAFLILSFNDFILLRQLAVFTFFSLTASYIHFAFLFPTIGFHLTTDNQFSFISNRGIRPLILFVFSVGIIIGSSAWVVLDGDIRNLDYQNKKLKSIESFFQAELKSLNKQAILIQGGTIDGLIENADRIIQAAESSYVPISLLVSSEQYARRLAQLRQNGFFELQQKIEADPVALKFRKDFFRKSYALQQLMPGYTSPTLDEIKKMGIDIVYADETYNTVGYVSKNEVQKLQALPFVRIVDLKSLFNTPLAQVYTQLTWLGAAVLTLIVLLLIMVAKRNFVAAINYLLFPLAVTLLYGLFFPLNIMNLFMMVIIMAIGIDYGIYMTSNANRNTQKSILFSLISTFAGFGVLVFSDINSLFSLGITATLGVLSILFLLIYQKKGDA